MREIIKGYTALVREVLGLRNDGSFISLPAGLAVLILICGIIGTIRNILSVSMNILPGFYSFHLDMIWTMFVFPIQLYLFPSAFLHWQLHRLGYRDVRAETVYGLSFHLQGLHLLIPFVDWFGYYVLGMPWSYTIGTHIIRTHWYTNLLFFTPGVIVAWWITGYLVARTLRKLEVRWSAVILTSLTTFLVILFPTYFLFTAFNTLFNRTFGLLLWYPQDFFVDSPSWFLHWGYGTYFALTALVGLVYYLRSRSRENA